MAEAKLLNCPTCGSSLELEGNETSLKCPYCGNTVLVPTELRSVDAHASAGANPVTITVKDGTTSIRIADLGGLESQAMNLSLGGTTMPLSSKVALSPAATKWIKISIWAFVIIMVVSVVVPLVCSLLGIVGAFAGILLPFFLR